MKFGVVASADQSGLGQSLPSMIDEEGSAAHVYVNSAELNDGPDAARNLADAVHYLGILHGQHPGVVEFASMKTALPDARAWLDRAEQGFARERLYLSQLAVAAGPLPSTPGHDKSEAAALSQRHAIETLARSDRTGCALGAAMALVLDWPAIRAILATAAAKLEVETPLSALPEYSETLSLADEIAADPAINRAMTFGAQQMLAQHRGLWNLLEAREAARDIW